MKEQEKRQSRLNHNSIASDPKEVPLFIRIILAIVFFILGFVFSNSLYFQTYPLFGRRFLAEVLISLLMGLVGWYIIPKAFSHLKQWFRNLAFEAITDIVTSFWEQQSERMREARQDREERKEQEQQKKNEEELKDLLLLDTSVLIDGRILDIAETGFLLRDVVVLECVIEELHALSDSKDPLKRKKGRRGLDLLKQLKKTVKVIIPGNSEASALFEGWADVSDFECEDGRVDQILVDFARKYNMVFVTLDFNLNKVASVKGIKVVNINDLANALRIDLLPGEEMNIKLVSEGQEKGQGVGYLKDGTMVVVSGGADLIGEVVRVRVKKSLQASAGKMFFGELVEEK